MQEHWKLGHLKDDVELRGDVAGPLCLAQGKLVSKDWPYWY
jgi:hypothetical protein